MEAQALQISEVKLDFDGIFMFEPIHIVCLVGWFYLCLYIIRYLDDSPLMPQKHKGWLNIVSLMFGPFVFFALYALEIVRIAEKEKLNFMGVFKKVVNGSLFSIGKQMTGARGASSIMLLDLNGQSLQDLYGNKDKSELSGALNLAETIIWDCLNEQASDVLIDPGADGNYSVRFRVDGRLKLTQTVEKDTCVAVVNSIKALSGMDIAERRRAQDGAFTARMESNLASFRVASAGVMNGEKLSIRVLTKDANLYNMDKIGLSPKDLALLKSVVNKQQGMVLVCGPTGSGKTTSLYAMLAGIDALERNIITVEDPVEYVFNNVSQIEVNEKAEITFAKTLRSILRQDPDVICVGEIRDEETAQVALQSAHTGHLVFATIHSNSNFSSIVRLMDLGIKPLLLSSALEVIVSQRLLRKLCDKCKAPANLNPAQIKQLEARGINVANIMQPVGCPDCGNTGYRGRIGVFDVLSLDADLKQRIFADNISAGNIKEVGERIIKPKLRKEAMKKVFEGVTSFNEVKSVIG